MFKDKHISNNFWLMVLLLTHLFLCKTNAQQVRIIDNKGTLINFNNNRVFDQETTPNPIPANVERDIWLNRTTSIPEVYHGNNWIDLISQKAIKPTKEVTTPLTLNDTHYKLIVKNATNNIIKIPEANNSNKGRIYIIENTKNNSFYVEDRASKAPNNNGWINSNDGSLTHKVEEKEVVIIQSDGVQWQQIN